MQLPIAIAGATRGVCAGSAALLLAAALATSGVHAAETNVERDDAQASAAAKAERSREEAERRREEAETRRGKAELDEKLEDAQKRLEKAASEVAALSTEIAGRVVEGIAASFSDMPRRTVIGVQLESGTNANGAKVQQVSPGGPAEQAGVRVGDVIVAVNGKPVKGEAAREVVRLLREVPPDTKVKVRVMRDGKPKDFDVVARPFDPQTFVYRTDPPPGFNPKVPNPQLDPQEFKFGPQGPFNYNYNYNYSYGFANGLQGMELTTLTPQLGKYFGADKGVLVVRAPSNDVFKLQDGDVIMSVDGRVPNNGSHLTRILRSYQPGEKLVMRVMRDRKPQEVEVTVPENVRGRRTRAPNAEAEATTL